MRRRTFLAGTLGSTAALAACDACGDRAGPLDTSAPPPPPPPARLEFFTDSEAATARAMFAALIPGGGTRRAPSADDAGVITFVDRVLREPTFRRFQRFVRHGLEDLDRICTRDHGTPFAAAPSATREAMLTAFQAGRVEGARVPAATFFAVMHGFALEGYWGAPARGGNRDMVSWRWAGIENCCHG